MPYTSLYFITILIVFQTCVSGDSSTDYVYDDDSSPATTSAAEPSSSSSSSVAVDLLTAIINLFFSEFSEGVDESLFMERNNATTSDQPTPPSYFSSTNSSASDVADGSVLENVTQAENSAEYSSVNRTANGTVNPILEIFLNDTSSTDPSVAVMIGELPNSGELSNATLSEADHGVTGISEIDSGNSSVIVSTASAVSSEESGGVSSQVTTAEEPQTPTTLTSVNVTDGVSAMDVTENITISTITGSTSSSVTVVISSHSSADFASEMITSAVNVTEISNQSDPESTTYLSSASSALPPAAPAATSVEIGTTISTSFTIDSAIAATNTSSISFPVPSTEADAVICSRRSSATLSSSENENIVSVVIPSVQQWDREVENRECRSLLLSLCRTKNTTLCENIKLLIIDEPSFDGNNIRLHLLAIGPQGSALDAASVKPLLEAAAMTPISTSTTSSTSMPTTSPLLKPSDHLLENPVFATSLIAVVVTVSSMAFLSLMILLLLQRHRRSRKGEWIVNSKKDSKSNGTQQTYGWCFENDAFATDEKKRPFPALLDDRRQLVALPVDEPSYDVDFTGASPVSPVPVPPSLRSFSRFPGNNDQSTVAVNATQGWTRNETMEEIEMVEKGQGRRQRY